MAGWRRAAGCGLAGVSLPAAHSSSLFSSTARKPNVSVSVRSCFHLESPAPAPPSAARWLTLRAACVTCVPWTTSPSPSGSRATAAARPPSTACGTPSVSRPASRWSCASQQAGLGGAGRGLDAGLAWGPPGRQAGLTVCRCNPSPAASLPPAAAYALGFLNCDDISARCMLSIFQFFATKTDASALRMLNGAVTASGVGGTCGLWLHHGLHLWLHHGSNVVGPRCVVVPALTSALATRPS